MTAAEHDKAGSAYWTSFWKSTFQLPSPALVEDKPANYIVHEMDRLFLQHLPTEGNSEKRLLEVGCGNSIWLSYFSKRFGYRISGIDYSEFGCEQTRKILVRDGCAGDIRFGDLFAPPADMLGAFDVVCSFGVVEHFEDTAAVLSSIARFLKPGGILITTVPNLNGPTGHLQKRFNKPVYDIHVVLNRESLLNQLRKSGLEPIAAGYFSSITFGVNLIPMEGGRIPYRSLKKYFLKGLQVIGKVICLIDSRLISLPKGKFTSEGIFTIARKA